MMEPKYYWPTKSELRVGMPIFKHYVTEYSSHRTFWSAEAYYNWSLNSEEDWMEGFLTEEDYEQILLHPDDGDLRNDPGIPIKGWFKLPVEYELVLCDCECHTDENMMHMMPCCINGYKKVRK